MYKGFNLKITNREFLQDLEKYSYELIEDHKKIIKGKLDDFLKPDGSLSATEIEEDWFPEIEADIFLSHSHKDKKIVLLLAGWLKEKFELNTFIDSCVWGYANDLLKEIDRKYCYNKDTNTYSYEKRNYSTSHVHMILSTAITKMIDKTECVFFLNTPNSITTSNVIQNETFSPWIYSEITTTQLIRINKPKRLREKGLTEDIKQMLHVKYDVDLSHLVDIDYNDLKNWVYEFNQNSLRNLHPLDFLYNKKG